MSPAGLALALVLGLFSLGALLIAVCSRHAPAARSRDLWRVYGSTILIAAAVLLPAALHPAVFSLLVAAAACRFAYELAVLHGHNQSAGHAKAAMVAAAALVATGWGAASQSPEAASLFAGLSAAALAASLPVYWRSLRRPPSGAERAIFVLAFPLLAAAHLAHAVHLPQGFVWIFLLYATVEAQDSMAFLFGRLFGRNRLMPRLSPGKTVEGALAGATFGLLTGTAIAYGLLGQPQGLALMLAAVITAAGFAGDLFTSALKRAAGTKDFPAVHPLHGGLLDIYDSTLMAALALGATVWLTGAAR